MIIQRDSLTFRGIACPWAVLLYPIYELVKQFLLSVPDDQLADNVSPFICLNIADIGRYPVAIAICFIPAFTGNEYGLARKKVDANNIYINGYAVRHTRIPSQLSAGVLTSCALVP